MDPPARLLVTDDLRRSRLTVFFRLLLALPHFVWFALWSVAALVAALANWIATLVRGTPPSSLHSFLSAYVRYGVHLTAYLALAANPYPGFTGEPGYPVDVALDEPRPQRRWTVAVRLLLVLPALVLSSAVGASAFGGGGSRAQDADGWRYVLSAGGLVWVCGFLGWFAALVLGRMPAGLRNLAAYGIGYTAQTYGYLVMLTDRYPNSDPTVGPPWELPQHPVRLELTDDGSRSRLTALFRLLLALPHLVWIVLWSIAVLFAAILNGLVALVRGRPAGSLHRFLSAYVRYSAHVNAFLFLVGNPFPGFTGARGYPVAVTTGEPERQTRWVTLFRSILVIPALLVAAGYGGALFAVGVLGWFAALATGRMPTGLRNLGAISVRYLAQTSAYWLIVTDRYPYAGPALSPPELEEEPDDEVGVEVAA